MGEEPGVVAIDGKTMRGTKGGQSGLNVVNAWLSEKSIILGQVFVDLKAMR